MVMPLMLIYCDTYDTLQLLLLASQLSAKSPFHLSKNLVVGNGSAALVIVDHGGFLVNGLGKLLLGPSLGLSCLLDTQSQVQLDRGQVELLGFSIQLLSIQGASTLSVCASSLYNNCQNGMLE